MAPISKSEVHRILDTQPRVNLGFIRSYKIKMAILPCSWAAAVWSEMTSKTFRACVSSILSGRARGVNMLFEREMGLIHVSNVYLPGGGGEQGTSSLTVALSDSACSFTPTPPVCGWFEPFSAGLGSWATTACDGSGSVGSGFFPSVSTGSFPSATASVQQTKRQAGAASKEHDCQQPRKTVLAQTKYK